MTAVSNPDTYRLSVRDLPADPGEFYAWQDRAACRGGRVAELFFAADYEPAAAKARREAAAVQVCSACPVRQACLDHALSFPERVGVWGGLTEDQRDEGGQRKAKRAADKARWRRQQEQERGEVAA